MLVWFLVYAIVELWAYSVGLKSYTDLRNGFLGKSFVMPEDKMDRGSNISADCPSQL